MKSLDENILLHYLEAGSEGDVSSLDSFFDQQAEKESYFVSDLVLSRVIQSIEENVRYDRPDVELVLHEFLLNEQIIVEDRHRINEAFDLYKHSKQTFVNCLNHVLAEKVGCSSSIMMDVETGQIHEKRFR